MILFIAALLPMCGALVSYLIGRRSKSARDYTAAAFALTEFALMLWLFVRALGGESFTCEIPYLLGRGLLLRLDGFRALYGLIAALMWLMTTLYSRDYLSHYRNRNRYYLFTLLTCGATVGVFLSYDLFTTFLFFEVMSFTSYVMVVHDEKPGAMRAGQTYLAVAILGGMVLLMGLLLLENLCGTLRMDELAAASKGVDRARIYLAGALILFGFAAKAGMYPLHIWLPKAHPVAPAPASALLSGVLTKAGVFGILVLSCELFLHDAPWGRVILAFGTITMFLGAFIALFSIDLKRTLACSSMSQIGFILVGVGMQCLLGEENALAAWGTVLHMMNHSLIKLALFMAAGVVYQNLHKLDLNEIRGFGRGKPLLMFIFGMGYLGIIGMPLFNGYVSKTLLHESIVEYIEHLEHAGHAAGAYQALEWIFLISGGLTAAYMTKLFVCLFLDQPAASAHGHHGNGDGPYMTRQSAFALGFSAAILPVLGLFAHQTMERVAQAAQPFLHAEAPHHAIHYLSLTNLKGGCISLIIGALVYFGFIRTLLMRTEPDGIKRYVNLWPVWLDLENGVYRPLTALVTKAAILVCSALVRVSDLAISGAIALAKAMSTAIVNGTDFMISAVIFLAAAFGRITEKLPEGILALLNATALRRIGRVPPKVRRERRAPTESTHAVTNSLSFGLLLFAVGFLAVMLYLLTNVV